MQRCLRGFFSGDWLRFDASIPTTQGVWIREQRFRAALLHAAYEYVTFSAVVQSGGLFTSVVSLRPAEGDEPARMPRHPRHAWRERCDTGVGHANVSGVTISSGLQLPSLAERYPSLAAPIPIACTF